MDPAHQKYSRPANGFLLGQLLSLFCEGRPPNSVFKWCAAVCVAFRVRVDDDGTLLKAVISGVKKNARGPPAVGCYCFLQYDGWLFLQPSVAVFLTKTTAMWGETNPSSFSPTKSLFRDKVNAPYGPAAASRACNSIIVHF